VLHDSFPIQIGSRVENQIQNRYRTDTEPDTLAYTGHCIDKQSTKQLEEFPVFETPLNEQASIYHERACEGEYFNKIMRNGNGFTKVIINILPSKQKIEILFEATKTYNLVET